MVPDIFINLMCPGLCNGHGICVNSTCICYENYTSIDCSIDKRRGPTVTSFRDGHTCDLQANSDCNVVGILGGNFMKTANSTCRTTKLKVRPPMFLVQTLTPLLSLTLSNNKSAPRRLHVGKSFPFAFYQL